MSSDSWDKDPFQGSVPTGVAKTVSRWDDEDDDENVVDSWDQEPEEEEEEQEEEPEKVEPPKADSKSTKKSEVKGAASVKNHVDDSEPPKSSSGVDKVLLEGETVLDSQEDYDKLKEKMLKIISDANKNANFVTFSEDVIHGLCSHLPSQDLRKLQTWVGNLQIEKAKIEKGDKPKKNKGKGKVKLKMEGDHDFNADYYGGEDYDDFM